MRKISIAIALWMTGLALPALADEAAELEAPVPVRLGPKLVAPAPGAARARSAAHMPADPAIRQLHQRLHALLRGPGPNVEVSGRGATVTLRWSFN